MMQSAPGDGSKGLSTWLLIVFALPALVSAILLGPVAGILPALYAERFGISLTLIGTVLLIARGFDAVIDPAIGLWSDRTRSRFGRRKPWIAVGYAITLIAMMLLFRPVGDPGAAYFLGLMIILYLGWSLFEIPYVAWALDISRSSEERVLVNSWRAAALWVGGIVFTLAPALAPASQGKMDFNTLGVVALLLLALCPIALYASLKLVPNGVPIELERQPKLTELWESVRGNKPFIRFAAIYAFIGLASGVSGAISFIYISSYLQIGDRFTALFLPATLIGPLTIPLWAMLLNRFDKYRVTAIAFTIYAFIMPLPWFIQPGPQSFLPMAIVFCALTIFSPLLMIAMPTIMGDIVDFDEQRTGKNRAGQYMAFQTLLTKIAAAVAAPLAFILVGQFGFVPGAANNSETAILGLRIINNLAPVVLVLPGLWLLWRFPLNDVRHKAIQAELDGRRNRAID
jgi:glycoside/pentoside/hexuronide:cation symporter, GPH family